MSDWDLARRRRPRRVAAWGLVLLAMAGWLAGAGGAAWGTTEAYATIHSAGVRVWPVPTDVQGAALEYRVQGATEWRRALDPVVTVANSRLEAYAGTGSYENLHVVMPAYGSMIRRVHGSVMYLEPDTSYELRVQLLRWDGSLYQTVQTTVRTKPNGPVYGAGRTLRVPAEYSTISAALDAAEPGDTVLVAAGSYFQSITITLGRSGEPGRPVTVRGEPGARLENVSGSNAIQVMGGAHDVIVEGFHIVGRQSAHVAIEGDYAARITIRNNVFDTRNLSPAGFGVWAESPVDLLIEDNRIVGQGMRYAMFIQGGRGVIVRNNDIRIRDCEDIVAFRAGPHEDCDIYGNYMEGVPSDDGFELEGGVNINVRVWGNTVNNLAGTRATMSHTPVLVGPMYVFRNVFFGSLQDFKVASNLVVNTCESGYELADFGPIFYYHNTFYHPPSQGWTGSERNFFRWPTALCHVNVTLRNNIIYGRVMSSSAGANTQADRSSYYWGQIDSDHNLWWVGPGTTNNCASYGLDLHSVFADPRFEDADFVSDPQAELALFLTPGSPALEAGVRLWNINDDHRGPAPDLGAFEGTSTFPDVPMSHWAWWEVEACHAAGIVFGYPDGTYRPSGAVARDQMAVFIARAVAEGDEGVPSSPGVVSFPDVPEDHWAYRHIEYAAANDIVHGYDDGLYHPEWVVDRGQMAVFVARAIATPTIGEAGLADYAPPETPTFEDVTQDNDWAWCYKYVEYIAAAGVVVGYDDGRYRPEYICSRDQMAVYIALGFALAW